MPGRTEIGAHWALRYGPDFRPATDHRLFGLLVDIDRERRNPVVGIDMLPDDEAAMNPAIAIAAELRWKFLCSRRRHTFTLGPQQRLCS